MSKSPAKLLSALLLSACCARILATGYYEPVTWLENGAQAVLQAPEFFWEIECKRIAKEFVPAEKRVVAPPSDDGEADRHEGTYLHNFTAKTDVAEFTAAVKSGYLKGADADAAIKAHTEMRALLQKAQGQPEPAAPDPAAKPDAAPAVPVLPKEADSEFADYHKGAVSYHYHNYDLAKAAWETLLKRPAAERKYRSTWAAYMLGKVAMEADDRAGAIQYFQMTRQLAKEGFADSLGLAADSYGWEANAEEGEGHTGKAARLYLTQLGSGDVSAVASLQSVIPDLPIPPTADNPAPTDPTLIEAAKANQKAFDEALADPLLRRLITVSVLSGVEKNYPGDETTQNIDAQTRWLAIMEKVGVKDDNTDVENLGWVAYMGGKYADAARWLKLSTGKTPAAQWLKAKLALRKGNTADAAAALSEAVRGLQEQDSLENTLRDGPAQLPYESTRGDLGTVLLARGDFTQALDTFLQTELWLDAAYVAERCLTTKELCDYANKHFSAEMMAAFDAKKDNLNHEDSEAKQLCVRFRALVARRLMREDHYKEARPWFDAAMQPILDDYIASLAKGNNEKTPKADRARALFHAAWLARYQGMELMGTEAGPDNAAGDGSAYGAEDVAMERLTGKPHAIEDSDGDDSNKKASPALPVSAKEKERLAATRLNPELRYHYRHVAAGLAWKSATLLPDGADETVDVLNTAGTWIKDKHEKQADRFYQAMERRCSKTEISKEAVSKHWFVEQDGPWSAEETARDKANEEAAAKKNQEEYEKREAERAKGKEGEAK